MVGNGDFLQCDGLCTDVPLMLQKQRFLVPLYLLLIQGADVVLGMTWLRTLGTVLSNFSVPSMTFTHNSQQITLSGQPTTPPKSLSNSQLHRALPTNALAETCTLLIWATQLNTPHYLALLPPGPPDTLPQHPNPQLQRLLSEFSIVFGVPHDLPPPRAHDHHIHLMPNSQHVNIKPYRYPHCQKEAMSKLLVEMLQEGIFRASTSPFSSPLLVIKKKDGSWCFCVDYRALNSITIKDRFPIPTVDGLLDELCGAIVFSKIDLCSGYHQILLAMGDEHETAFRTIDGHFEFLVMPFGLTNAPSSFKKGNFSWSPEAAAAFTRLKEAMTSTPVL